MGQFLRRVAKPLGFLSVAVVAAVAFVAASPNGIATVKAAYNKLTDSGDKPAIGSCRWYTKTAHHVSREHRESMFARFAANEEADSCATGKKAAHSGSCAMSGKAAASKDGASCPMHGAGATPAVDMKAGCGTCPFAKKTAASDSCSAGTCPAGTHAAKDLLSVAAADGEFSTFVLAAKAAGLGKELQGADQKTILAPTNDAFRKLSPETWASLLQDNDKLRAVLARHIVAGVVKADDLKGSKAAQLGGAKVTHANIVASNGMIQGIDTVLMPEAKTAKADDVKVATTK